MHGLGGSEQCHPPGHVHRNHAALPSIHGPGDTAQPRPSCSPITRTRMTRHSISLVEHLRHGLASAVLSAAALAAPTAEAIAPQLSMSARFQGGTNRPSARSQGATPARRPRQSPRVPLSDLRQPPPAAVLMRGGAAPLAESGRPRPLSIGTAGAPPLAVPDRTPRFPGAGLHRRMQATAAPALPQWRSAGPGQRHAMLLPLPSRRWGTRPSASIPALQASAPADPSDRHQPGRTGTAPRPVQCQPLGEPGPLAAGCRHSAVAGGRVVERLRLRPTPGWLVAPLSAVLPADHRAGAAAA
jgi:hypothetical protein